VATTLLAALLSLANQYLSEGLRNPLRARHRVLLLCVQSPSQGYSRLYALKQVPLRTLTPREKANAVNEVRLLASVSSPQVVTYYDSFVGPSSGSLCIVMEYAEGGDLQK